MGKTSTTDSRDAPRIEPPPAAEQETVDGLIEGMTQQSETVEAKAPNSR